MERIAALKNRVRINTNKGREFIKVDRSKFRRTKFNPAIIEMVAKGGESFFRYLKRVNLSNESDILVLPSKEHFYYEETEVNRCRTLINLKKLNQIRHLDKFLHNLFSMLPPNANFIGCFSNDKALKNNGSTYYKPARLLSRFISFLDSRPDHILNKSEVSELLKKHGYDIIDMTEIDGLIYFYSKNSRQSVELLAS
jgi:hypothetical protein